MNKINDWEIKFDIWWKNAECLDDESGIEVDKEKVKDFIRSLLKSEKAKMARETIDIMNKIWKQEIEKIVKEES